MFPKLETSRLILREIGNEDIKSIFLIFSNLDVTRFYGMEPMENVNQAKQLITNFANSYQKNQGIRWGIVKKEDNELIGTIGFNNWVPKNKRAEIGYDLHPSYWRNGYATEAIQRVISYGFSEMELNRIGAVVYLENKASRQLLKSIGYAEEGILKEYMLQNGQFYDVTMFSLLKSSRE